MPIKVLVLMNSLVFFLIVPILEISPSHVFNPDWPAHARLHEVWQLFTNAALSLMAMWLAWKKQALLIAALISVAVGGGFVFAFLTQTAYGGSMAHPDGSELVVLGVNPAFGVVALITAGLVSAIVLRLRQTWHASV